MSVLSQEANFTTKTTLKTWKIERKHMYYKREIIRIIWKILPDNGYRIAERIIRITDTGYYPDTIL